MHPDRRRAGRAIRKQRREMLLALSTYVTVWPELSEYAAAQIPLITAALDDFGRAMARAGEQMMDLISAVAAEVQLATTAEARVAALNGSSQ